MRSTSCSVRSRANVPRVSAIGSNSQTSSLPAELETAVAASLEIWRQDGKVRRLWAGDAQLWTGATRQMARLAWHAEDESRSADASQIPAEEIRQQDFSHMPAARHGRIKPRARGVRKNLRASKGRPELLGPRFDRPGADSNDRKSDRSRAIPSSSSRASPAPRSNRTSSSSISSTCAKRAVGDKEVGSRFIAITDPGSQMQEIAERDGSGTSCSGVPSIGGRYSVLSDFGMVPARSDGTGHRPPPRPNAG